MTSFARSRTLINKGLAAVPAIIARPRHLVDAFQGVHWATLEMLDQPWIREMDFKTVIDVGANCGQFASAAHVVFPHAVIHSFEPLSECYDALSERMKAVPEFFAYKLATGDSESVAIIHKNDFSESSSLLEMEDLHRDAFPWTSNVTPAEVFVKPLDVVFEEIDLAKPALLKVDVQGYELPTLKGAGQLLGKVSAVLIEVSFEPLYAGEATFEEVHNVLITAGFQLRGIVDQLKHPVNGRILQGDAFYTRSAGTQA